MSAMAAWLLAILGLWSRTAQKSPLLAALIGLAITAVLLGVTTTMVRAWLEQRTHRVAAGPIFALAGVAAFALTLAYALVNGWLYALDVPLLQHRLLLLLGDEAAVRTQLVLPADGPIYMRGPVAVPLAVVVVATIYFALVLWVGRTLSELTSLERKPDDILARERAEQQKAIDQALKEGRPLPTEQVVSLPLADDRFGKTYKVLGHWTSVERVEERFVRWQRPLLGATLVVLLISLAGAAGGHLSAMLWAGIAIAVHGLGRNLRTPQKQADPPPKEAESKAEATTPAPLRPLIEAVHRDAGPLALAPALVVPQPASISPGTDLKAKRILEDMRVQLGLTAGLYVHQGLACDAFAARKNVLLTTPPLSGKRTLLDLFVLYTLLVDSETVLYLVANAEEAHAAEERLRQRAEAARWQWNISVVNLSARGASMDLARAQPGVVFADARDVHREICGRQGDWQTYLGALGLVVIADLETHHGVAGAHLAHLLRRLRRAAQRAAPCAGTRKPMEERVRFAATAAPIFRELGQFAERLVGRPFLVLGPEVDGAPQADRLGSVLPASTARSDLHPAVHTLGEALAYGFAAEMDGYESLLSSTDVARANEITLARGVATRGRSFAAGATGKAQSDALADATVVIARASSARYAFLGLLTSHIGFRAGNVPKARVAAMGAGEHVGVAAAPGAEPEAEEQAVEAETAEGTLTEEQIAATNFDKKVLLFWQPDLEPFSALLAKERPTSSHPDLKLGCALVVDPHAERIQRFHLRCALSEAEVEETELRRDFSRGVVDSELQALRASQGDGTAMDRSEGIKVIERTRKTADPVSGALKEATWLRMMAGSELHGDAGLDASGEATHLVDRQTGDILFALEKERAFSAAYPGRMVVYRGRRYSVLPFEQQDMVSDGHIACQREEKAFMTSKIRKMVVTRIERRTGQERRKEQEASVSTTGQEQRLTTRRTDAQKTIGGCAFGLRVLPVHVAEEVLGLRRHGLDGFERDIAYYSEPICCDYMTRAAVLELPEDVFGLVDTPTLHALTHLFRVTLPAYIHHREEDLDVVRIDDWQGQAGDKSAAIAFVDMHPGGAGFADAINLDVIRHLLRWSLALTRRCSGQCKTKAGCLRCLQIANCHAEPKQQYLLDKVGADRVLTLLVGQATAATFGAQPHDSDA